LRAKVRGLGHVEFSLLTGLVHPLGSCPAAGLRSKPSGRGDR
jgi:hypothetical protein